MLDFDESIILQHSVTLETQFYYMDKLVKVLGNQPQDKELQLLN